MEDHDTPLLGLGLQAFTRLLDGEHFKRFCFPTVRQVPCEESTAHCSCLTDKKQRHREIK